MTLPKTPWIKTFCNHLKEKWESFFNILIFIGAVSYGFYTRYCSDTTDKISSILTLIIMLATAQVISSLSTLVRGPNLRQLSSDLGKVLEGSAKILQLSQNIENVVQQLNFCIYFNRKSSGINPGDIIDQALKIDMTGVSLWETISKRKLLERLIETKLECRFILIDTRCHQTAQLVGQCFNEVNNAEQAKRNFDTSIGRLKEMHSELKKINAQHRMQYKVLDFVPAHGIFIYQTEPGENADKFASAEIYAYRRDYECRPIIKCNKNIYEGYRFLLDQFEELWKVAYCVSDSSDSVMPREA